MMNEAMLMENQLVIMQSIQKIGYALADSGIGFNTITNDQLKIRIEATKARLAYIAEREAALAKARKPFDVNV